MQHRILCPIVFIRITSIISLRIMKWFTGYIIFGYITNPKQYFQYFLVCIIGYTYNILKYLIDITIVFYVFMSRKWIDTIYAFQSKIQDFTIRFSSTNQKPSSIIFL